VKFANFSIDRPVTTLMMMITLVMIGSIAAPLLPVDLYPNMEIPSVSVSVSWPGGTPEQVENQVTNRVEASLATVPNVTSISSSSNNGRSQTTLQFDYGADLEQAMSNVRDKMDRTRRQLPSDADAPVISRVDLNSTPIMSLAVYGDSDLITLRDIADNVVSPAIQRAEGVASVTVSGGRTRQVQVILDQNKLLQYGISLSAVSSAIGADNTSSDVGNVKKGDNVIPLHFSGDFKSTAEIQKVQVPIGRGQTVPLSELAQIVDTYQDVTSESRKDGQLSVSLSILKESDGNTVAVSSTVRAEIENIKKKLPAGVNVTVLNDSSVFIRQSINTVVDHTLLGALFSVFILYLFLRSVRATLVIGIVIPIAVISTFSLMYFSNQTFNIITLGGLALGLGSLVDFAVVMLESIYRKKHEGEGPIDAAKKGAAEVGTAIMASALAQVAVFVPTLFISGLVQQYFVPMALTVSFSHIAALFAAVTLVPMLASKLLKGKFDEELPEGRSYNPSVWFGRGLVHVTKFYMGLLKWSLRNRWVIVSVTLLLIAGSVYIYRFVGTELTPRTDEGELSANVSLPAGSGFDATNEITTQVESIIKDIPDVDTIYTTVNSNNGRITADLKPLGQRRDTDVVVEEIRNKTSGIVGAQVNVNARFTSVRLPGLSGGGGGDNIQINLNGPDLTVLNKLADLVVTAVRDVDGIRSVRNPLDRSSEQFNLLIDRDAAAHYGVSIRDLLTQLRAAYQGTAATQLKTGSTQVAVQVKYPSDFSQNLENLDKVVITTSSGGQIPVSQIAKVEIGSGPSNIRHQDQQRVTNINASVFGRPVGDVSLDVQSALDTIQPPDGYSITMVGERASINSSFKSLELMLVFAIVLVYMVMASQFESLYSPFIIMFSLPPTIVGAIGGLFITGRTINMNTYIGMIMLVGIVVNNAIVLIDYTNQLRKRGLPLHEALIQAGQIRLRPILMTTCTTILAMLPLVIGYGEGAETQASMATVVAFGLAFSTMITLLLVPVVYSLFDSWGNANRRLFRKLFKRFMKQTEEPTLSV
jgi:HAE1 family hydrophobic/amphiphilic exporter-1